MGLNSLVYTNHLGIPMSFNDGTRYSLRGQPTGIYGLATNPIYAPIPRKSPVAVYQAHIGLQRKIDIRLMVRGRTRGEYEQNLYLLRSHCYSDAGPDKQGILCYTGWGGRTRCIACAISDAAEGQESRDDILPVRGETAGRTSLTFLCGDPTFYDPAWHSATTAFNGTTSVDLVCINHGNANAYPEITYATDAVNVLDDPQVTDEAGHVLLLENTVAVGEHVTIVTDPANMGITYYGIGGVLLLALHWYPEVNWYGQRSSGSQMPILLPGENNLRFVATNVAANATITVRWHDRYASFG